MKPDQVVQCRNFPCTDIRRSSYHVPGLEIDPLKVAILLISESSPQDPADDYFAGPQALFARTTVQAFQQAGASVASVEDILELGVYLTTAVKCGRAGRILSGRTIETCSVLLEKEINLFPNVRVYLLMGNVAIRAVNTLARRAGERRVIPAGSSYLLRGGEYRFRDGYALPSYVQAGPAFLMEKAKRRMIAEDIRMALYLANE
jgi:hypothetical protein